jgi:hypothetical protein
MRTRHVRGVIGIVVLQWRVEDEESWWMLGVLIRHNWNE